VGQRRCVCLSGPIHTQIRYRPIDYLSNSVHSSPWPSLFSLLRPCRVKIAILFRSLLQPGLILPGVCLGRRTLCRSNQAALVALRTSEPDGSDPATHAEGVRVAVSSTRAPSYVCFASFTSKSAPLFKTPNPESVRSLSTIARKKPVQRKGSSDSAVASCQKFMLIA